MEENQIYDNYLDLETRLKKYRAWLDEHLDIMKNYKGKCMDEAQLSFNTFLYASLAFYEMFSELETKN